MNSNFKFQDRILGLKATPKGMILSPVVEFVITNIIRSQL